MLRGLRKIPTRIFQKITILSRCAKGVEPKGEGTALTEIKTRPLPRLSVTEKKRENDSSLPFEAAYVDGIEKAFLFFP